MTSTPKIFSTPNHLDITEKLQAALMPPDGDPTPSYRGTVKIRYNSTSEWGTICGEGWDLKDANVICRMLGFRYAIRIHLGSEFGRGPGKVWLEDVECDGYEKNILDCPHFPGLRKSQAAAGAVPMDVQAILRNAQIWRFTAFQTKNELKPVMFA
ncbi:scavenger receptor class A member 5-like [Watersipora subatra]|uniref:scavenger receptor class A member 5-like n=1 Tax=Watersipora subatra TaxID=2589382 RepID=UPI00355BFDC2